MGVEVHDETLTYIRKLKEAGIEAEVDVFHGNTHGFDYIPWSRNTREARKRLIKAAEPYMK